VTTGENTTRRCGTCRFWRKAFYFDEDGHCQRFSGCAKPSDYECSLEGREPQERDHDPTRP